MRRFEWSDSSLRKAPMPVRPGSHRAAAFAASIALLSLAIGGAEVFGSEPLPTLEMSADGEIQIAVDGTVSDYR